MKKPEQAANVKAVRAYLEGIGQPVSSVQGYEVVARALGYKSKHVLAQAEMPGNPTKEAPAASVPESVTIDGTVVRVLRPADECLSLAEMQALDFSFDFVLPFSLDEAVGDTDAMNEFASRKMTGNDYALQDIGFDHVPGVNYGKGLVAYRVTGCVTSPEEEFGLLDAGEPQFYADLLELANCIVIGAPLSVAATIGGTHKQEVVTVNAATLGLLKAYAQGQGANNEQVNLHGTVAVFGCQNLDGAPGSPVRPLLLHELKYAVKVDAHIWTVSLEHHNIALSFKG